MLHSRLNQDCNYFNPLKTLIEIRVCNDDKDDEVVKGDGRFTIFIYLSFVLMNILNLKLSIPEISFTPRSYIGTLSNLPHNTIFIKFGLILISFK